MRAQTATLLPKETEGLFWQFQAPAGVAGGGL